MKNNFHWWVNVSEQLDSGEQHRAILMFLHIRDIYHRYYHTFHTVKASKFWFSCTIFHDKVWKHPLPRCVHNLYKLLSFWQIWHLHLKHWNFNEMWHSVNKSQFFITDSASDYFLNYFLPFFPPLPPPPPPAALAAPLETVSVSSTSFTKGSK